MTRSENQTHHHASEDDVTAGTVKNPNNVGGQPLPGVSDTHPDPAPDDHETMDPRGDVTEDGRTEGVLVAGPKPEQHPDSGKSAD